MTTVRSGHVLKLRDGSYYIEAQPYRTASIEGAELYFKYFDLMEAQARALRNTGEEPAMVRVSFRIADIAEQ